MTGEHPVHAWRFALAELRPGDPGYVGPTARLVAWGLSLHVSPQAEAFPGAGTLAVETGLSERSVRSNLDVLADAGWLVLLAQGGLPGGRRSTLWRITLPVGNVVDNDLTPEPPAGVTPERAAWVENLTPATGAATPEPPSTTPATHALTPERAAPELEELEELAKQLARCGACASANTERHAQGVFCRDCLVVSRRLRSAS